jgi:hypothetical protein
MITRQRLIEQTQRNVGLQRQTQRSGGFSDGQNKAPIQLSQESGEEAGVDECARWAADVCD